MPTYVYKCSSCGAAFEQYQKFSDDPLTVCPSCGGKVARVMHAPGIVFKGSGWYINDSRGDKSALSSSVSSAPADSAAASSSSESAPAKSSESAPAPAAATSAAE